MDGANNTTASGGSSNVGSANSRSSNSTIRAKSSTPSLRRVQTQPSRPTPPSQTSTSASASASANNSAAPSPLPSREPSPSRPSMRTTASARTSSTGAPISRSRKNSQTDVSPARSTRSSQSTTTTLPRTLSATSTPQLLPATSDMTIRAPVPQKPSVPSEPTSNTPRWPVSPRLKSPPPILGKPNLGYPPSINVQRSTPSPGLYTETSQPDSDVDDSHLQPGVRTPARTSSTALETVQEASPLGAAIEKLESHRSTVSDAQAPAVDPSSGAFVKSKPSLAPTESGSESGSIRAERRQPSAGGPPPTLTSRQSSTSSKLNGSKARPGESSQTTMIVETETVPSIPQGPVVPMPSNGSLRTKPSTETIRPKKEKKKANRKQTTVASGTASSKADIFEANVATAVDEADTSDSEETFVYDSNPADARDRPQRFHSRTPSATSMVSQVDRNGMRSIHSVMEGATNPPVAQIKKNMKFVNTFSSGNESFMGDDEGKGPSGGRSNSGSGRGTARQHHHFNSRHSARNNSNHAANVFDAESPLPINPARSKLGGNSANSRSQSSGPPSPKVGTARGNGRRGPGTPVNMGFDLDEGNDERTPLLAPGGAGRSSRRNRRHPMAMRNLEGDSYRQHPPSFLNRFAGCLVLTVMLMLVVSGAVGFMFATSQPLDDVQLVAIRNVIASEQELMFDMEVRAHNPNVVVVSIDGGSLDIFAKSPHAGRDSEWWRRPRPGHGSFTARRRGDKVRRDDPLSDQPSFPNPGFGNGDDSDSGPNMLLGKVEQLDNPLTFEGAFFHGGNTSSNGSVRLGKPGNETEGGRERWERILEDDFELIVQGTLSYALPLSQRIRSAPIRGRAKVRGSEGGDDVWIEVADMESEEEKKAEKRWWMGWR